MKFYTVNQAAEAADVAWDTANTWAEQRDFPTWGSQIAIPADEFDSFVEFLKTRRENYGPQSAKRSRLGRLIKTLGGG
jgi:hypothetical protein